MRGSNTGQWLVKLIRDAIAKELPPFLKMQKQRIIAHHGALNDREEWEPLSPATVNIKRKEGSSTPYDPLRRTGKLMRSFTVKVNVGPGLVRLEVDNKMPYAESQDHGFTNEWDIDVPARPFMNYTSGDIDEIRQKITEIIKEALTNGNAK